MKLMLLTAAMCIFGASSMNAAAQSNVDPRAVEACQAEGGTFVQISDCLPAAHVAVKTLDAFDQIYGSQAAVIPAKCRELNKTISGVATCVVNAVESAIDLAAMLPTGTSLDDPIFDAVKSADELARLQTSIQEARDTFPDQTFWGGGVYYPYR